MNYTDQINQAVENAKNLKSKLSADCLAVEGCSSPRIRHLLNNLIQDGDRYLEIGCYKGSTSIAALYKNNPARYYLVDNYSEFPPELGPEKTKSAFLENFIKCMGTAPNMFINQDCFSLDRSLIQNVNVYLFDGDHNFDSHRQSLTYYYPCLENEFILCVDDWDTNGWGVREGTYTAMQELNLKIKHKVELPHGNVSVSELAHTDDKWWFGFAVFHMEK